ncbi:NAD-binding protein [Streptomyces sp. NPDC095817]|uniref:NAD-binding protein n=1 Tax=Streptomyces sp. NPDC095817 TaxID=3155082 RepID=UPI0033164D8C
MRTPCWRSTGRCCPPLRTGSPTSENTALAIRLLLVNLLWFGQAVATAEALLIAQGAGIGVGAMADVLSSSPASSAFIRDDLPSLLAAGDYLTSFGLHRIHDQLAAVTSLAEQLGSPHSLADAVRQVHEDALRQYGPVDGELLAVALLEGQAGMLLRSKPQPPS